MKNRDLEFLNDEVAEMCVTFGDVLQDALDKNDFTQSLLTRTLENNLAALESLRAGIERAQRKDINDVRDFGDTPAASLFVGVESDIDYEDLLDLIDEYKFGVAKRHLADLTSTF